jgi:hypothetical protein
MGRTPSTLAPPRAAGPPAPARPIEHATPRPVAASPRERLDAVLDGRQVYHQAQGMLAELAGCSLQRAGEALLQVGAGLGAHTANDAAKLFLINAADALGDPDSRLLIRRFTTAATAALGPSQDWVPQPAAGPACGGPGAARHVRSVVATLVGEERGLEVRGELDVATAPLVAAAFADRRPGNGPGGRYLLDLQALTFIDVRGIRVLSDIDTQIYQAREDLQVNPPTSAEANYTLRLAISLG